MLLSVRAHRPVIDQGTSRDHAAMDRHARVHKVSVIVPVAHANLRNLTGAAADGVLMALRARCGVEDGTQPQTRVFPLLEDLLIAGKTIPGRLEDAVVRALGAGIRRLERRRVKPRGRLRRGLLSDKAD